MDKENTTRKKPVIRKTVAPRNTVATVVSVPATVKEIDALIVGATADIDAATRIIRARGWERRILLVARCELAQGDRADLDTSRESGKSSCEAYARELDCKGLSADTITRELHGYNAAAEEGDVPPASEVVPGVDVPVPLDKETGEAKPCTPGEPPKTPWVGTDLQTQDKQNEALIRKLQALVNQVDSAVELVSTDVPSRERGLRAAHDLIEALGFYVSLMSMEGEIFIPAGWEDGTAATPVDDILGDPLGEDDDEDEDDDGGSGVLS